jgi:class 3 adenylate cyclase/CheY-like chemotaxis protein
MTILIVDDSAGSRLLLSSILKAAGHKHLEMAESARGAFERLGMDGAATGPSDVDLILMDISMPDLDGIEACARIKQDARLQDIPIIMVTASSETKDLQLAFAAGAMDYINKPPNKVELLARVRSALELKKEMDRRKEVTLQLQESNRKLEQALADLDEKHRQLLAEQEKSERLLLNILPQPIAERLKQEESVIADNFADVTVLFADIVDFTKLSARIPPADVVAMLNDVFSKFDRLAEKHGLEKIKTIGDAYMVVGGLPTPRPDHAEAVAEMALDMRAVLGGHTRDTGSLLTARIGINSGPVVAGVIGTKKFIYDLWGDTVNIASRMEALGASGVIQVTEATYARLRDRYVFERRGTVQVKGKGEMVTYQLVGRKAG